MMKIGSVDSPRLIVAKNKPVIYVPPTESVFADKKDSFDSKGAKSLF